MANLYKIIFIGEEEEKVERGVNILGPVPFIYQTYLWADTLADAIEEVKSQCEQSDITIKDFTKISLVVSQQSINYFTKERL